MPGWVKYSNYEKSGIMIYEKSTPHFSLLLSLILLFISVQSAKLYSQDANLQKHSVKTELCIENFEFPIIIDSIIIEKNWRTRDKIIVDELTFNLGDKVSQKMLENSITRIWNIGNFVHVDYCVKMDENDRNVLVIQAKDAFTIVPIISVSGNKEDYNIVIGVEDKNFLGRNIRLRVNGNIGTFKKYYKVEVGIPRQLLYKNMTLKSGFQSGGAKNYIISDDVKESGIAYDLRSFFLSIGNPFNQDFYYTFSPDMHLSYFNHTTDSSLLDEGVPSMGDYSIDVLTISVSENFGYVSRIRHQKNGFETSVGFGAGIGLNKGTRDYLSWGTALQYHKLFNSWLQFSTIFKYEGTTADYASLYKYVGPSDVKGIITGEIAGKHIYVFNAGFYFTYLNTRWFAIEQSIYFNTGYGAMEFNSLFSALPRASVGTGFRFMIPMVPWAYIKIDFTYSGAGSNWFFLEL